MKKLISFVLLCLLLSSCSQQKGGVAYEELPLGGISPEGWLREKLELQRDNISSDMDQTYPQVMGERNGWLGGDGDQWERGPYWIDGLLPLAYILDDESLKAKVQPWIEWALASQTEDGNFGPRTDYEHEQGIQRNNSLDWWPRMVVLKILQQHYNATADERVLPFMERYFHYQLETLCEKPLDNWTNLLLYLGARVRVFTSRESTRIDLCGYGVASVASSSDADLSCLDILINTAPAPIFPPLSSQQSAYPTATA